MKIFHRYGFFLVLAVCVLLPTQVWAYHAQLDGLLKSYVSPAEQHGINYLAVDYDSWANDTRHQEVVNLIKETYPETIDSENAKKAFWINAYNVLTIDMIVQTGERETVSNLGDALKSPFSTYKWKIGGKEYTLEQIKSDILRPMGDPRVLFAVTSATITSPDLRRESYRPARLEGQLRDQVLIAFNNTTKGIQFDGDIVRVPQFMNEYKMDFKKGDLKTWLQGYYPDDIDGDSQIGFFQRNMALNAPPPKETAVND